MNSQGIAARPLSRRLPSPVGLPFRTTFKKAAAAGIEPASGRLTAAYPYQHEFHRNEVGVTGFEPGAPPRSGGPCSRDHQHPCQRCPAESQTFLHAAKEHPAGVETALSAWQADRHPLHHGCLSDYQIVKDRGHRTTAARRCATRTHVTALRVRCLCR